MLLGLPITLPSSVVPADSMGAAFWASTAQGAAGEHPKFTPRLPSWGGHTTAPNSCVRR